MKDHFDLLLPVIQDEDRHVSLGKKWFLIFCEEEGLSPKTLAEDFLSKFGLSHPPTSLKAFLSL